MVVGCFFHWVCGFFMSCFVPAPIILPAYFPTDPHLSRYRKRISQILLVGTADTREIIREFSSPATS